MCEQCQLAFLAALPFVFSWGIRKYKAERAIVRRDRTRNREDTGKQTTVPDAVVSCKTLSTGSQQIKPDRLNRRRLEESRKRQR